GAVSRICAVAQVGEPERTVDIPVAAAARGALSEEVPGDLGESATPPAFVLLASAVVGFAFLLMELVWYRMLGPILGGSTYTFGMILAVALLGIGAGGALYALRRSDVRPTIGAFALPCVAEGGLIVLSYALGVLLGLVAVR